jgi:hypothetical protein
MTHEALAGIGDEAVVRECVKHFLIVTGQSPLEVRPGVSEKKNRPAFGFVSLGAFLLWHREAKQRGIIPSEHVEAMQHTEDIIEGRA